MRLRRAVFLIVCVMAFQAYAVQALDLGRVAQGVIGQVLNNAINSASQPRQQPRQEYYQSNPAPAQTQTQTYTYEEYMAQQSAQTDQSQDDTARPDALSTEDSGFSMDVDDDLLPESEQTARNQDDMTDAQDTEQSSLDVDDDNLFESVADENEEEELFENASDDADEQVPANPEDTIEVIATGIGKDSDGALRNALRAAIEQAVGTMVDSETLAQNDEVVNDQILSYSTGFVESHKVIGEPRIRDGLVTIKIQAQVKSTELTEKLKAASIHVKEVDGESLFGKVFTALEQEKNAGEVLKKALDGFPEAMLDIKLAGKPNYDRSSKEVILSIEISLNRNKYYEFAKEFINRLKLVAEHHETIKDSPDKSPYDNSAMFIFPFWKYTNRIVVCSQMNDARTNATWEIFTVSKDIFNSLVSATRWPKFTVDIVDEFGNSIVSGTYDSPASYALPDRGSGRAFGFFVFPLLLAEFRTNHSVYPATVTGTWNLRFDVSMDEIKRMRNVVCKIIRG